MIVFGIIVILLFVSLALGQLGGIMISPGIVIYVHDILIPPLLAVFFLARRPLPKLHLKIPILLFVLVATVSLFMNSQDYTYFELLQSSLHLMRWVLYVSLYGVVASGILSGRFWLRGIYITTLLVSIFGLVQYMFYPTLRNLNYLGWDEHYYRLFSTFFDPNFVGLFISLGFFLGMTFLISRNPQSNTALYCIGQVLLLLSLFLTYSRSSFLAFSVGMIVFLALYRKYSFIIIFLIVFLGILTLLPTRERNILRLTRSESAIARLGSWQQSINLFLEKPILGHGFNTLRFIQLKRGWMSDEPFVSRGAGGVDSSILFVAITTGSIGVGAFLFFLYRMIQLGIPFLSDHKEKSLAVAFLASIAAIICHSLFVNSLFYPWILLWMWIVTGVVEERSTADKLLSAR